VGFGTPGHYDASTSSSTQESPAPLFFFLICFLAESYQGLNVIGDQGNINLKPKLSEAIVPNMPGYKHIP
jgi:hypothetical protein